MKRILCGALAALLLTGVAIAEAPTPSPTAGATTAAPAATETPTAAPTATEAPTAAPEGTEYTSELFRLRLPYGMEIVEGENLAGFDAALDADYPFGTDVLLAASDAAHADALCILSVEDTRTALEAARSAAEAAIGSGDSAVEVSFGSNKAGHFSCATDQLQYEVYFFANGSRLLILVESGLSDDALSAMLESLVF